MFNLHVVYVSCLKYSCYFNLKWRPAACFHFYCCVEPPLAQICLFVGPGGGPTLLCHCESGSCALDPANFYFMQSNEFINDTEYGTLWASTPGRVFSTTNKQFVHVGLCCLCFNTDPSLCNCGRYLPNKFWALTP